MRQHFDGSIGPDQRLVELAAILAVGVSRLNLAARRAERGTCGTSCQVPPESPRIQALTATLPLERSRATGVTVGRAVNRAEAIDLGADLADLTQEFSTWF